MTAPDEEPVWVPVYGTDGIIEPCDDRWMSDFWRSKLGSEGKYSCPWCGIRTNVWDALRWHVWPGGEFLERGDRVICPGCGVHFTTWKAMLRHMPEGHCLNPADVPSLEPKTKGRWGWVTDPLERDTPEYLRWADDLDTGNS